MGKIIWNNKTGTFPEVAIYTVWLLFHVSSRFLEVKYSNLVRYIVKALELHEHTTLIKASSVSLRCYCKVMPSQHFRCCWTSCPQPSLVRAVTVSKYLYIGSLNVYQYLMYLEFLMLQGL